MAVLGSDSQQPTAAKGFDMDRRFNEALGWMAILYVHGHGIRANNYLEHNQMPAAEWNKLKECIDNVRANATDVFSEAQLTQQSRCGNCQEQSSVVMLFLMKVGLHQIDQMILFGGTQFAHSFVVLGRREGSNDSDPSTWGPDAVVIDPWHDRGKVYPAAELQTKGFRGYHNFSGQLQPKSVLRVR